MRTPTRLAYHAVGDPIRIVSSFRNPGSPAESCVNAFEVKQCRDTVWGMIRFPISHYRYVTEPAVRADIAALLSQNPGETWHMSLDCRKGGSCCAIENVNETMDKLRSVLAQANIEVLATWEVV